MSKTSKQTATSQIDPNVAAESNALMALFKSIASMPHQTNRGVTVAGFTPQQRAAMEMGNDAAAAFGFAPAANPVGELPAMRTSAQGIKGYSTAPEYDKSVAALPKEVREQISSFYQQSGKKLKKREFDSGGGKK